MNREQFLRCYREIEDRLFARARSLLDGDSELVFDVIQEAVTRALEMLSRPDYFNDCDHVRRWLFRVIHNLCMDQHRYRRRFETLGEEVEQSSSQSGDVLRQGVFCCPLGDFYIALTTCVDALKDELRLAFELYHGIVRDPRGNIITVQPRSRSLKEVSTLLQRAFPDSNINFSVPTVSRRIRRASGQINVCLLPKLVDLSHNSET